MAAEEQLGLGAELVPPRSVLAALPGPVWGIDPSTQRVAVAQLDPMPGAVVSGTSIRCYTLSLEQSSLGGAKARAARLSKARAVLVPWFQRIGVGEALPHTVALEEPFGAMYQGKRQTPVIGLEFQGMILGALWEAFGLAANLELVSPSTWKKAALGAGSGFAKPPAYLAWARSACGYEGELEDEAAALGVATWAALEVVKRRG